MQPFKPKRTRANGPESQIQAAVVAMLRNRGWYVIETHGNMYQRGLPDLFACHSMYGQRWIEIKNPDAYGFTPAQMDTFPKLCANGSAVWVLVAATEQEYNKLNKPCNWWAYLK